MTRRSASRAGVTCPRVRGIVGVRCEKSTRRYNFIIEPHASFISGGRMITPRELKELYEQGQNISTILRGEAQVPYNTEEVIELSYVLQTGSYIAALDDAPS